MHMRTNCVQLASLLVVVIFLCLHWITFDNITRYSSTFYEVMLCCLWENAWYIVNVIWYSHRLHSYSVVCFLLRLQFILWNKSIFPHFVGNLIQNEKENERHTKLMSHCLCERYKRIAKTFTRLRYVQPHATKV